MELQVSTQEMKHIREVYNILQLISDLGGVFEIIAMAFGAFVTSYTDYSFIMTAADKFYGKDSEAAGK